MGGGILLILGVLHGLNLIALPVMGRLLTMNRRLDEETPATPPGPRAVHRTRPSVRSTAVMTTAVYC